MPLRVRASPRTRSGTTSRPARSTSSRLGRARRDATRTGTVVFESGTARRRRTSSSPGTFLFKAEPVDQHGNLIDRHNLWEMVGVRYRRSLFPGFSDTAEFTFVCPHRVPADRAPGAERHAPLDQAALCRRPGPATLHVAARLLLPQGRPVPAQLPVRRESGSPRRSTAWSPRHVDDRSSRRSLGAGSADVAVTSPRGGSASSAPRRRVGVAVALLAAAVLWRVASAKPLPTAGEKPPRASPSDLDRDAAGGLPAQSRSPTSPSAAGITLPPLPRHALDPAARGHGLGRGLGRLRQRRRTTTCSS